MTDLATRIEAAESGSRELDREIARRFGWHRVEPRFTKNKRGGWIAPGDFCGTLSDGSPILDGLHGTEIHREPPRFTESVDDGLALVQEGWCACISYGCNPEQVDMWHSGKWGSKARGAAATPALALSAALVRAALTEDQE